MEEIAESEIGFAGNPFGDHDDNIDGVLGGAGVTGSVGGSSAAGGVAAAAAAAAASSPSSSSSSAVSTFAIDIQDPLAAPASAHDAASDQRQRALDAARQVLAVTVGPGERVGQDGVIKSGHIAFNLTVKTSLPNYARSQFSVARRYTEFTWLRESLTLAQPGCIIPPLPEKAMLNNFAHDFVSRRRMQLQTFIDRLALHPVLRELECVRVFLESEELLSETLLTDAASRGSRRNDEALATATPPPSPKGFLSGFKAAVGSAVQSSLPKSLGGGVVQEVDDWFEEQKNYTSEYARKLSALQAATGTLKRQFQELTDAYNVFSVACQELAACEASATEPDNLVGKGYEDLGALSHEAVAFNRDMANSELAEADDMLVDYVRLMSAVKELLDRRDKYLGDYQHAERARDEKRDNPKASATDLAEAERRLEVRRSEFEAVSAQAKVDLRRFYHSKSLDMQHMLKKLAMSHLDHSVKIHGLWKVFVRDQYGL